MPILTKDDLLAIEKQNKDDTQVLPPTVYVMGSVLANHADALDRGDFRFNVAACGGCSALPLMARFAHLDEELEDRLRGLATHAQLPHCDAALAEIVHLPADRPGNILDQQRVVEGKSVSVRVDLGSARILKKKTKKQ